MESLARAGRIRFIATRLLATGLIRWRARGRRAVTACVMTLAMSSEVEPNRPTRPACVRPNEAPTAALYSRYGSPVASDAATAGGTPAVAREAAATSFHGVLRGAGPTRPPPLPHR